MIKELTAKAGAAGDLVSIPGSEGSSGGGNGRPLQYFCLEHSIYRGTWKVAFYGVTKRWTEHSRIPYYALLSMKIFFFKGIKLLL